MENKKSLSFPLMVVVIILGVTLYKQFDFESLKFEKPALAVLYIIVFLAALYFLIKKPKKSLRIILTEPTGGNNHERTVF